MSRNDNYMRMLAELCDSFEAMTKFQEEMLKGREKDLDSKERNLLAIAYKNSVASKRKALQTVIDYECNTDDKKNHQDIQEYRKKIEEELTKMFNNVINTIDTHLLKKAEDDDAKVFYLKMKGDYYKYMAEYSPKELQKKLQDATLDAYSQATKIAVNLSPINRNSLGLVVNFSVFLYEVKEEQEKAFKMAQDAIFASLDIIDSIDDDIMYQETTSIIKILQENIRIWKGDQQPEKDLEDNTEDF